MRSDDEDVAFGMSDGDSTVPVSSSGEEVVDGDSRGVASVTLLGSSPPFCSSATLRNRPVRSGPAVDANMEVRLRGRTRE